MVVTTGGQYAIEPMGGAYIILFSVKAAHRVLTVSPEPSWIYVVICIMTQLLSIGAAAKALGVSTSTLRRWEASGRCVPARTEGGQRQYDLAALRPGLIHGAAAPRRTVAYARVSGHDQRADLERQKQVLTLYCASQGWPFDIIADLGSGMDHHKKG